MSGKEVVKEVVEIPPSATGLKLEKVGDKKMIQFLKGKVKSSWNTRLYYLTCSGNSKNSKRIRAKLEKIQGKEPKDTVKFGTKRKQVEQLEKSFEKVNKKAKKSTEKELLNVNQFVDTFREMSISMKAEYLNKLKVIYSDCVLDNQ
jgi:hypothetical protein